MQAIVRRQAMVILFCLGLAVPAYAANNVFMSVTGPRGPILGDAKSPHGSQWIQILEFDESIVSPRDPQSGLPTGKRQHQPVKIVKQVDASSPQLQKAASTGEHLKEVVFQFYRNNGGKDELYETIRVSNVMITGIQSRSAGGDQRPKEEITFDYQKIETIYAPEKQSPAAEKTGPAVRKP